MVNFRVTKKKIILSIFISLVLSASIKLINSIFIGAPTDTGFSVRVDSVPGIIYLVFVIRRVVRALYVVHVRQ